MNGRIEIGRNAADLAQRAAEWMSAAALAATGPFRVALAGGSTPRALYEELAGGRFRDRFPWERVDWFWGDERWVPREDPRSNYRMAREAMLSRVPVSPGKIHPIPTSGTPEEAARSYERTLQAAYGSATLESGRPLFEVVLLGVGADGHTASLLPGQPVLEERNRWVAAVPEGREEARITLTYPALESSRHVAFLVAGEGKAAILRAIRGGSEVPAARLAPSGELIWFVDRQAAGSRAINR